MTILSATPIETGFLPSPETRCNQEFWCFEFFRGERNPVSEIYHANLGFFVGIETRFLGFIMLIWGLFVWEKPGF